MAPNYLHADLVRQFQAIRFQKARMSRSELYLAWRSECRCLHPCRKMAGRTVSSLGKNQNFSMGCRIPKMTFALIGWLFLNIHNHFHTSGTSQNGSSERYKWRRFCNFIVHVGDASPCVLDSRNLQMLCPFSDEEIRSKMLENLKKEVTADLLFAQATSDIHARDHSLQKCGFPPKFSSSAILRIPAHSFPPAEKRSESRLFVGLGF